MSTVKLIFKDEIRRFKHIPSSFTELSSLVTRAFSIRSFSLSYLDREGDLICLENDTNLEDAIAEMGSLRIYIKSQPISFRKPRQQVWETFTCQECRMSPIIGSLCVCRDCPNYTLCQSCEMTRCHHHPMVIHKNPRYLTENRFKMKFVSHVNWKNRGVFQPGDCGEKIWKVMNNGDVDWPKGCRIGPFKGDIKGDSIEVPPLKPMEEAEVKNIVKLPIEEKKHNAIWRLFTPYGVPFGDKLFLVAQVDKHAENIKRGLKTLVGMGFAYEESLCMLVKFRGNVELALNHLVNR